jgi:hypothetical protein
MELVPIPNARVVRRLPWWAYLIPLHIRWWPSSEGVFVRCESQMATLEAPGRWMRARVHAAWMDVFGLRQFFFLWLFYPGFRQTVDRHAHEQELQVVSPAIKFALVLSASHQREIAISSLYR